MLSSCTMLKIYLDTNVWSRPFDKPSQRMIEETNAFFDILEKSYKGSLAIVGSLVLDVEVGRTENLEKRAVTERIIAIFVSEHFQDIPKLEGKGNKRSDGIEAPRRYPPRLRS